MVNWYDEYKQGRVYDRCLYDVHKAQFILTLLGYGHMCCEVFTCGFENHLLPRTRWRHDRRISQYPLKIVEYPGYLDWWNALRRWDVMVRREDFDKSKYIVVGEPFGEFEPFYRVYDRWEYTLTHMNRYIMQHEAIYGRKEMWKKDLYK